HSRSGTYWSSESRSAAGRSLLRLEGSHIDREPVLHVRLEQPLIRFVHLLDRDHLKIRRDVVLPAEIKHLLRLRKSANQRAREAPPAEQQAKHRNRQRLLWCPDHGDVAVALQQPNVSIDVMLAATASRMKS